MLAKSRQTVIKDVIKGLQQVAPSDVTVHEPVTASDLPLLMREASQLLRSSDYLSIIVVRHK